jgi:hypothetical protein
MMHRSIAVVCCLLVVCHVFGTQPSKAASQPGSAQDPRQPTPVVTIPPGSVIAIAPMDGFDTYLAAAIQQKKVPVVLTIDPKQSDYLLVSNEYEWQGWFSSSQSNQFGSKSHAASTRGLEAGLMLVDKKTQRVVWAYEVHKSSYGSLAFGTLAMRGQQSISEACAKHLKQFIEANAPDIQLPPPSTPPKSVPSATSQVRGGIEITSVPSGADVELDGSMAGKTPCILGVAAGVHTVSVNMNGYKAWKRKIIVTRDKMNIAADLEPMDPASAGAQASSQDDVTAIATSGKIYVISDSAGADVYLDDSFEGKTPMTLDVKPGRHSVRLFEKDYQNWWEPVTIAAGSQLNLTATLVKSN